MLSLFGRLVGLGVRDSHSPAEARRVQTINLIALGSVFFNCLYNVLLVVISWSDLWPILTINLAAIALDLVVLAVNRRGRTDAAMFILFGAAMFNLVLDSLLLGLGTGVYLFLMMIPAVVVLVTPSKAIRMQLFLSGLGLAGLLAVVLADPPTPPSIADSPFEPLFFVLSIVGTVAFISVTGMQFRHVAEVAEAELQVAHDRSERLLHNILPIEVAERLKGGAVIIADRAEDVSILFADLVGSTPLSERLTAAEMVTLLNDIFCPFDDLADELGLEKIKTVGDAYMVVGGLPVWREDHVESIAEMALEMRGELTHHPVPGIGPLQMRFGIHIGSVVAGVIGKRKFSYDLWGDTVNTASRMESHGIPGEIHVTEDVYRRLKGAYLFESRGVVDIKGKGSMRTYLLQGRNRRPVT